MFRKRPDHRLILEALEERIFFDANPLLAAVDTPADQPPADEPSTPEPADGPDSTAVSADERNVPVEAEAPVAENTETTADTTAELPAEGQPDTEENSTSPESTEKTADEPVTPEEEQPAEVSTAKSAQEQPATETVAAETDSDEEPTDANSQPTETPQVDSTTPDAESISSINQIVFIDNSVNDSETLTEGIRKDIENDETTGSTLFVSLDSTQDEVQQITDTLAQHSNLSGIHILSHGSTGSLILGNTVLDTGSLDHYAQQLSEWGSALDENGDILLYGCTIAKDGTGVDFIDALADVTGADIAASDDPTGNIANGGDWDLEVETGLIESRTLNDASGDWDGLLAPPPDPESSGTASSTTPMINSAFMFSIAFDNDPLSSPTADPGFGPFLDVVVPWGISIQVDPTVSGHAAPYQTFTWFTNDPAYPSGVWKSSASGPAVTTHPYNTTTPAVTLSMPAGTQDGDTWYLIDLPFGSFANDQPATKVDFNATASEANDAEPGVGLNITYKAGFRYGNTATNTNGPLQEDGAAVNTLTIIPQVIDIAKSNNAPEGQTVTGPNYPVTYTLRVNIAPDATVDAAIVKDYLPENAVFRGDLVVKRLSDNTILAPPPVSSVPTAWAVLGSTPASRLLELNLGSINGRIGANSAAAEYEITYSVYFDKTSSDAGSPSLLGAGGNDRNVVNESSVSGTYTNSNSVAKPVSDGDDTSLGQINTNENATPSDNQTQIAAIVTQKTVVPENVGETIKPGTILKYTIQVDISDYYAASNIILNDEYGDGQTFYTANNHSPTISFSENGTSPGSTDFAIANYTHGIEIPATGITPLTFRVSDQLVPLIGPDGTLTGGAYNGDSATGVSISNPNLPLNGRRNGDATYATITYYTIVDNNYNYLQNLPGGTGDASVDIGDRIQNKVTVNADITDGPAAPAVPQEDISNTEVQIASGSVEKTIYKVNGLSYNGAGVKPGDLVTYHLKMTVPIANFEKLVIKDFLPLPVYDASELTNAAVDFNGIADYSLATSYLAGDIEFGPGHNLNGTWVPGLVYNDPVNGTNIPVTTPREPDIVIDTTNNALVLNFGSYDAPAASTNPATVTVDILFTVTIQNKPMADGLPLINQGEWSFNNTINTSEGDNSVAPIVLNEPEVHISKGVVAKEAGSQGAFSSAVGPANFSVNPATGAVTIIIGTDIEANDIDPTVAGSVPIDANLGLDSSITTNINGIDGGDKVTFALAVYNTGGSSAYGVNVVDTIPTGFVKPSVVGDLNIKVYKGNGTQVFTGFSATIVGTDQFRIAFDNDQTSSLAGNRGDGNGNDVFLITYQLTADNITTDDADRVLAGSTQTNTAKVDFYTGQAGGNTDWTEKFGEPTDTAQVITARPVIAKELVRTEIDITGNNQANQATIGELVTYRITLTVPEGQMRDVILKDTLDNGLAFVGVTSVSPSVAGLSYSGSTTPVVGAEGGQDGRLITFNLGQITNTNSSNATAETIVIEYQAVVLNTNGADGSANNQAGQERTNRLDIDWHNDSNVQDLPDVFAANITIVEPTLSVAKLVANQTDGTTFQASVPGDSGDIILYQITITNGDAPGDTTAFDISLADVIPASLGSLSIVSATAGGTGTVSFTGAGTLVQAFQLSGNTLGVLPTANIDMQKNSTITITVQGAFSGATGDVIPNTAEVRWTSMDGDVQNRTGNNDASDERDGSSGLLGSTGTLNDYQVEGTATITSPSLVYKAIVATSEASTAQSSIVAADAAIGEIVRYRLYASIGEGSTNNFQIQDNLPEGTRFLNDGNARWTFIASAAGKMTSAAITNISALGNITVAGDGETLKTLTSTNIIGTFADNNIAATFSGAGTSEAYLYTSGQDVFFRFGNIVNSDNDTSLEFVVVEFNVLVENIATNQAATTRANTFTVLADAELPNFPKDGVPGYFSVMVDNDRSGTRNAGDTTVIATDANNNAGSDTDIPALSNNAIITLVEPHLTIDKSVIATTGAVVTYQVVLTNSGTATAFDATVTDILPRNIMPSADLDLLVSTIAITASGGATTGTADHDDATNRMSFTSLDIPVGGTVTVTYQATVLTTTSGATAIENTATTTWTSLPGEKGTAGSSGFFGTTAVNLGVSGDATGERNGSGGVNDYTASDNARLGSLGDRVYFDQNGSGNQDGGGPGLVGVMVTVRWAGTDGFFDTSDDSVINAITGADGIWTVAGLPLGSSQNYRVSAPVSLGGMTLTDVRDDRGLTPLPPPEPNPDSLGIGISAITLTGADAATTNNRLQDFGYRGSASLGNRIYIDADGDGAQDANGLEPSLPGVQVTLTWAGLDGDINTAADNLTFTTTSTNPVAASDPNYLFQFLPSGTYTVAVPTAGGSGGVPDNMALTDSVDNGALSATATVTTDLTTGEAEPTMDFGYRGNRAIGDRVWYDADGDGDQDTGVTAEPGIPGVTVTLLWGGPDGDLATTSDNVTFTTTTDANGNYLFSGLPVNDINDPYRVTVTQPPSFPIQIFDSDGLGTPNQSTLNLTKFFDNLDQDFGYRGSAFGTAQLGNLVWEDLNGNGRQDMGEPGIDGVRVELFYAGSDDSFQPSELATPLLATTTAAGGIYQFNNLVAGTYALRFGTSDGVVTYVHTVKVASVATDENDSDADATTGRTGSYVLSDGMSNTTVDGGLYRPVSLGDRIYYDLDRDGVQDAGEPGIPGMPVEVVWLGPDGVLGGNDDRTFTTTSGANGIWSVTNLPPGSYQVSATPSASSGYTLTDSLDNGVLSTTNPVVVSTTSGVNLSDIDFGYTGTGSIGDQLWIDGNRNGLVDAGESGIPGVQLTIGIDLNGDGSPDFTTTTSTDGAGLYLFSNLPAGRHTITINPATLPPGLQQVYDPDGGMDNLTVVNLGAGENARYADFGYAKPVVQPPDPRPPIRPPETPESGPDFVYDPFFIDRVYGHKQTGLEAFLEGPSLFERRADIYQEPPLLVSPIYSGHAEPGTTITLNLYDHQGHLVGYQTVMADTGGNWLANFSGILLNELPHLIEIDQTMASYNESTAGGFNMRTYFTPSFGAAPFTRTALSVDSIFASLPGTVLDSLDQHTPSPLRLGWDDFYGYEFFTPSTNPAENHL